MVDNKSYHNIVIFVLVMGLILFSFNIYIMRDEAQLLYDSKRFYVLGVIILSLVFILISKENRSEIVNSLVQLSGFNKFLLLMFIISTTVSTLQSNTIYYYSNFSYLVGMMLLCCFLKGNVETDRYKLFQLSAVLLVLLFSSVSLFFLLRLYYNLDTNLHTIFSFVNPRFLNQVQVWLVIPTLYLVILSSIRNRSSIFYFFALILTVSAIIATDARGVSLALLLTILLWAIIDKKWRIEILKVLFYSFIAGYLIKLIFLDPFPAWLFLGESLDLGSIRTGTSGRLQLWKDTLGLVSLWGNGGGYFVCVAEAEGTPRFGHPHNSVLQILVDWGWPALITFLVCGCQLIYNVIVTKSRVQRVLALTLIAGLTYSLVSGVLTMPLSQILFILFLSLYWTSFQDNKGMRKYKIFEYTLVVFSLVAIIFLTMKSVDRYSYYLNNTRVMEQWSSEVHKPEFWLGSNCE
ncbi:O-antigen ligase family protein [Photobacterium sp. BZF1]|uniref:O-antigen ligase family protein n=1 Tax=Photobacterium sp. BZF1 TaxID=1904457 RepID=UPI00165390E3|nr:O-antigen ligase family protein [Photobacterium sp. BZF1]MBC7002821.1 O-antigen ligase family protein [Photobacterium sp. BZF1]